MTVTLCDKCRKEIKTAAEASTFFINLEEWSNIDIYAMAPVVSKRYQLCVDCYRKETNELHNATEDGV